jgi:uncharacterized membrane protein YfcA
LSRWYHGQIGGRGRTTTLNAVPVDEGRIRNLKIVSLVLIGFLTSVLSGLLGIGGGVILIPAMVYLLGMNQHRAHGTSLAVMSPVVLFSAIFYSRHGFVNWVVAIELMVGGIIGAAIGARICNRLSAGNLRGYFGLLVGFVGIRMLYGAVVAHMGVQTHHAAVPVLSGSTTCGGALVVLVGVVTGTLSGLFGIGGGIIMVPVLVLAFGFTQLQAQGVSLAVIIPVSISGALIHSAQGNVRWNSAFWLGAGGVLGGLIGSCIAVKHLPEFALRGMFGVLMLTMGSLMFRHKSRACS